MLTSPRGLLIVALLSFSAVSVQAPRRLFLGRAVKPRHSRNQKNDRSSSARLSSRCNPCHD